MNMDLKSLVANTATVFTIGVFLSGIQICQKIWIKRSTADISALPFICGFVSSSLWLRYGISVHDSALIVVNLTGSTLQVMYIICYSTFVVSKDIFLKQLLGAISVLACLFFYTTLWLTDEEMTQRISGLSACTAGILFMASPLASLAHVLKTKSVESLPFFMIVFTFIMATLWTWYGILLDDRFIQVPNFLGALLSGCQLCLFFMFPTKRKLLEVSNA